MEPLSSSKDSSQHPRNSGNLKVSKKCSNGTVAQDKVGNHKFKTEDRKKLSSVKKCSHVEILNTTSVNKKKSPFVIIDNETSHVDILHRIQAVGIPKTLSLALCDFPVAATHQQDLNQPKFQSSVVVMKNLETLKNLEIETWNLLSNNVQKDGKMQKLLNSKVSTVLNRSKHMFCRLQSISFNVEQLVDQDETRIQNIAGKNAPQMRYKDPKISLEDFIDCMVISKSPAVPEAFFHGLCCQYQINPFTQHQISDNNLISYSFWSM